MKRELFALGGYFGFGNAGDEMIARSIQAAAPDKDWRLLGRGPDRWNALVSMDLFRRSRALVFGGGELFQTRTSRASLLYYAAQSFLARFCGARFLAYGMGLDPGLPAWARAVTVSALNLAERIWFRDEESLSLYRSGGGKSPASVAPDPVWVWPVREESSPAALNRTLWIPRWPSAAAVKAPALLLHPREDEKRFGHLAPLERWETPADLFSVLRRYDAVVSMRYHGIVLAALAARPVVAVAAHGKVASLGRSLGCPVLSPEASSDEVRAAVEDAFRRRGEIGERARGLREKARRGLESFVGVLNGL